MRFLIASGCPIATTSLYRCVHLSEQLQALGHETRLVDWFDEARIEPSTVAGCDAVFLYRLPMSEPLARAIETARTTNTPVLFDTDDLVFEPDLIHAQRGVSRLSASEQLQHAEGVRRYLQTLEACDAVTTATPFLAELAARRGKLSLVHRNALGHEMLDLANRIYAARLTRAPNQRVVIGYGSGTPTHDFDFAQAEPALCAILDRFPETELWLVGPLATSDALDIYGERVRRFPLTDWPEWFDRASRFDIALAPLELGNVFCRAKSEIKFVETGALGVPLVASRMEPFEKVITDREDGMLAAETAEWTERLRELVENPDRRAAIGGCAREKILRSYTPEVRVAELAAILPQLLSSRKDHAVTRL